MVIELSPEQSLIDAINTFRSLNEKLVIRLSKDTRYELGKDPLIIDRREETYIEGNGAVLCGHGDGCAVEINCGKVSIDNLKFSNFMDGIYIRCRGQNIQHIKIASCDFEEIMSVGISSGITKSDGRIEDLTISDCVFEAPSGKIATHCPQPINIMTAAWDSDHHPIHHTYTGNINIQHNKVFANQKTGNMFMLGICIHGACNYSFYTGKDMVKAPYNDVSDSIEENIKITDNDISGVFDIGLDVIGGLPARERCILRDVVIEKNTISYWNTGINIGTANIPCHGEVHDLLTTNVLIRNNRLEAAKPGPHEPQTGIMIFTLRAESQKCVCTDCLMEHIDIEDNIILAREVGIGLKAVHGTQDHPYASYISNITLRYVRIRRNQIIHASYPVRIISAHLEGRTDPFWGYPVPEPKKDEHYSTWCEKAGIDHIEISDNKVIDYDVAFYLLAAWACGRGLITDCEIGKNLVFRNNILDKGERVFAYRYYCGENMEYEEARCFNNRIAGNYFMAMT